MSPDPPAAAAAAAAAAVVRRYHDKEEFVTGHAGTTPHEVFLLCLVAPVGLLLHRKVRPHVVAVLGRRVGGGGRRGVVAVAAAVVAEFLMLILPMMIVQTSLLPRYVGPCLLLAGMSILASSMGPPPSSSGGAMTGGDTAAEVMTIQQDVGEDFSRWTYLQLRNRLYELNVPIKRAWRKQDLVDWLQNHHPANRKSEEAASIAPEKHRRRPASLSMHRACVYVLTTIAVLAVDFPIFPRRFCKTERGGYGWMDLGAASFVIIAGWASAVGGDAASTSPAVVASSMRRKFVRKCTPLLLLGMARLATNKGLEYQEHVSEYGVHWNFFFTLCCVEGFMVAWGGVKRSRFLAGAAWTRKYPLDCALAMSLIVPYQLFLSRGGQEFIENGDRTCGNSYDSSLHSTSWSLLLCNAFVANREGVLGVVGYLSLRLLSEAVARACMLPVGDVGSERDRIDASFGQHRRLFVVSSGLWMAHLLLTVGLRMPNSRRSTNAPFVLWTLAHNISLLGLIQVVATRAPSSAKDGNEEQYASNPRILEAVNRFGLAVFLSSNLLTGLVNLTVDTLHSSDGKAVFILSLYLGLVCGFAMLLDAVFVREKVD